MNRNVRVLLVLAAIAAAARLFALTFLHPLNWDEVEYFRATDWVRQGLVPFRDFWEHHTPLQWFVFAPVTGLTSSPGADAIILMRWAQLPLWIGTFWLLNRLMQRAGTDALARWTAIVLALTSSLLMISAMEYRVDVLANLLYLGGLILLTRPGRNASVLAGLLFCLAGFANLRLGPLLAVTVILNRAIDLREQRWGGSNRANLVFAGVLTTFAAGLGFFWLTGSLGPLYQHVWVDNYAGEKLAERVPLAFLHRIVLPFGFRIYGGGAPFQWSGVDLAGVAIILAGLIGLVRALRGWRAPGILFFVAVLQLVNLLFIAGMKFVYHYHLQIAVLLMLPLVASVIRSPRVAVAFAVIVSMLNLPIVLLRGKELELQYQDRIMREVHARTSPGAKVFDGVGWAIRREPAWRFWFLPVLARQLVQHGHASPLTIQSWTADPPEAVITDRNAVVWLTLHPQLGNFIVRHYLPLWRNLLLPGLSARVEAGDRAEWIVPAAGRYRVVASSSLAEHSWFRAPLALHQPFELLAQRPAGLQFLVDGSPAPDEGGFDWKRGSRVVVTNHGSEAVGLFLVPNEERILFRQPPAGVTIDAEGPRSWHLPKLSGPTPTSSR